ncbi:MAG: ATP-dependent protease ATPase subunit HslU [Christensenellales bacterium]|jgi:ATP-dependent HslUV protease ATP-binding subunit HslU
MSYLTPKEIVAELDRYIIGQQEAKRAVAIALRNRYRRSRLPKDIQDEITPKNIIMSGPTGVGKTEIARRLAKLMNAPFVKVEATKFTEVGYVGRDVDSMVRDLVEASIRMIKEIKMSEVRIQAQTNAQMRLIDLLVPVRKKQQQTQANPLQLLFGPPQPAQEPVQTEEEKKSHETRREEVIRLLNDGRLEETVIEIEVQDSPSLALGMLGDMGADINLGDMFSGILPKKTKKRRVPVKEARKILEQEEADKLIDMDDVQRLAVESAEQNGIIFLDEIDKIAGRSMGSGPDVSREGVQRDILPIIEGSTVNTKYGPVKTDYMLFIAAGAFHVSKISDLIPELQGRFPIRVDLKPLGAEELKQILIKPDNAIIKQYKALMEMDGLELEFTDEALEAIAKYAASANETNENIGARRLHTIIENLLDEVAFEADGTPNSIVIDEDYVNKHIDSGYKAKNLKKYIL